MKTSKRILGILGIAATTVLLAACGNSSSKPKTTTITVGASPVPHAQILKHVQPQLKKEGVNLKIKVFQDYVMPNKALEVRNYASTTSNTPFLNSYGTRLTMETLQSAGGVHLEPISAYSKKVKNLKDVKDGATILGKFQHPDYGRILTILQDAGLIKVKKGIDITTANFSDITSNLVT